MNSYRFPLRTCLLQLIIFSLSCSLLAQNGFHLERVQEGDRIPFQLINNLLVVKAEVNGTTLSFLLDTGAKASVLFSSIDSLYLRDTSSVKIKGLGAKKEILFLRSDHNTVQLGHVVDTSHTLFVGYDDDFSLRMGVPVNGILGNDFFENLVINIDYISQIITVHPTEKYTLPPCKRCEDLPLRFVLQKPFVKLSGDFGDTQRNLILLVDSGNSDALWLFNQELFIKEEPKNYFRDHLGFGLGGAVFGKRTRIPGLRMGDIYLSAVNTSFPDKKMIKEGVFFKGRNGSLGGGFLKRFTVTFDFKDNILRLKRNRNFKNPFHYNMSGLTLESAGKKWNVGSLQIIEHTEDSLKNKLKSIRRAPELMAFHYTLLPKYKVSYVREGSVAEKAGIEVGDKVLAVNGRPAYRYKLYQLMNIFFRDAGKRVKLKIEHQGMIKKVSLSLSRLL